MLQDAAEAEDAAQDAFLQSWRALPGFRAESSFSTWIVQIVTRRCLNLLRLRRPIASLETEPEARDPSLAELVETRAELETLKRTLARLTPEQRAALVLRELEGLSYEEIAEVLEISVPAVKGRIHRARLELVSGMRQWR